MATLTNGLNTDNSPLFQPKGSYRFALNAVNSNDEDGEYILGIEKGNKFVTNLIVTDPDYGIPTQMYIIGKVYIDNNKYALFTVSIDNRHSAILQFDSKSNTPISFIASDYNNILNFNISHPITAVYRLKNGCDKVIYWTDNYNDVRTMVMGKEEDYYTYDYIAYTKGQIHTAPTKYDIDKFSLQKFYDKIPKFDSIEVINGGKLKPGSYNFAIQYIDKNNNPTEWITTSEVVLVYEDDPKSDYNTIHGDEYNEKEGVVFGKAVTSKAIELHLSNLDNSYQYYRIGIIEAISTSGKANRAFMSPKHSINKTKFVYDGNIEGYELISVEEIALFTTNIGKVGSLLQVDHRLLLANTKSKYRAYCSYQQYASRIKTEYVTKYVPAALADRLGNDKNPDTLWLSAMGGEVYALGIVYVFKDGVSPVYHIPGRPAETTDRDIISESDADNISATERWEVYNTADANGKMGYYELKGYSYPEKSDCNGNDYWGKDYAGNDLKNTQIRHHRFPNRKIVPLHAKTQVDATYTNQISVFIEGAGVNTPTDFAIQLLYDAVDNLGNIVETKTYEFNVLPSDWVNYNYNKIVTLYTETRHIQNLRLNPDYDSQPICIYSRKLYMNTIVPACSTCNTAEGCYLQSSIVLNSQLESYASNDGYVNLIGAKFSNIDLPEGAIGYYIVRGERDKFNRQVVSKAYSGKTRKSANYIGFMGLVDVDDIDTPQFSDKFSVSEDFYSIVSPRDLFLHESITSSYIKSESFFKKINLIGESHTGIIQDVAGTKTGMFDKDGFDWQGGVRGYTLECDSDVTEEHNYKINKSLSFGAVAKKTSEQYDTPLEPDNTGTATSTTRTIYNCSYDNKAYLVNLDRKYSRSNEATYQQGVEYVALMNNIDIHPILSEINYIKMDANLHTEDTITSFGFDTKISAFNPSYSTYQGLSSHPDVLGFIVAAVAVAAAAVVSIVSLGTLAGLAAVGAALVIASAMAKITADAIQTFTNDYKENHLDELMLQGYPIQNEHDTMLVAGLDFYKGLYIENTINIGLRIGSNSKVTDFLKTPTIPTALEYVKNKWLVVQDDAPIMDKTTDNGTNTYNYNPSGAKGKMVYRGVPCAEVYKVNLDYARENKEKKFSGLPDTYDCCSNCIEEFPDRIYYSEKSFSEEVSDSYRTILPLNYIDIPGEHSEITKIFERNNALFVLTPSSLWLLPKNIQERVTGDYLSLVGTGGFFSVDPRIVKDSDIGSGGTTQIHSLTKTDYGIVYVSDYDKQIYLMDYSNRSGVSIKPMNDGISKWLYYNMDFEIDKQITSVSGKRMTNKSNHYTNVGYHMGFDYENKRLLVTKIDYKVSSPFYVLNDDKYINNYILSSEEVQMYESNSVLFNVANNQFYTINSSTNRLVFTLPGNTDYFIDKSWTLSYSFLTGKWISFHNFLPNVYLYDKDNLFSLTNHLPKDDVGGETGSKQLWRHNADNIYRSYYGNEYGHVVEYVGVQNPTQTTIIDNIVFNTKAIESDNVNEHVTFNEIILYNSKQNSGRLLMVLLNDDQDYMMNTVSNIDKRLILKKRNKDWFVSGFRDMVANDGKMWIPTSPFDKELNSAIFDNNLDWNKMPPMKDKYIIVRLILNGDPTIHTNLLTNFVFEIENT